MSEQNSEQNNVTLTVADVMTKDIITIDENATVKQAATIMDKNQISCLITLRKGRAIGIITERDLLKRIIVENRNPEKTKVAKIMSTPLEITTPDTNLEEVLRHMFKKKIKKLAVINKQNILGLISLTDIVYCQPTIMTLLKTFAAKRDTPKSMKQILNRYIV